MLNFISEESDRLDKFLASKVDASRARVQKAIKDGKVLVNDQVIVESDFQIREGDRLEMPELVPEELKPSNLELKVVFENAEAAVIDKPAGLVVHPGAGNLENTMANALLTRFPGIEKVGEPHRPGIVHRLDEDTSGLILIAKTQASFEYFKLMFSERRVEKEYLALVHGVPAKVHDLIDVPLEKVPLKRKMSVIDGSASGGKTGSGKEAQTEYWVLKTGEVGSGETVDKMALLRVKLHTGRTHQIRAHLSYIGHPIVGDAVYGTKKDASFLARQFLHAYHLKFQLPDQTWIELYSPLPEDLKQILNQAHIQYENPNL